MKSNLNNTEEPVRPSNEEAMVRVESNSRNLEYPTFEEDDNIVIQDNFNSQSNSNNEIKEKKNFLGKVGGFFSDAGKKIKQTATEVSTKVKQIEIKDKLKQTGQKTVQLAKDGGNFIADKTKQAYVKYLTIEKQFCSGSQNQNRIRYECISKQNKECLY